MKVPILIPNIFNHPFTYNSDLHLKVEDYVVVHWWHRKKKYNEWRINIDKQQL